MLHSLYRHADGFLGWGKDLLTQALGYVPERAKPMGDLPALGVWTKLEVDLSAIEVGNRMVDGIAFIHDHGRVLWGRTTIEGSGAHQQVLWGDTLGPPPEQLEKTRIEVSGLQAGTKINVLFEDREIVAAAGYFVDDFRGRDLYQRFGGGPGVGYGGASVALHVYEIP